MGKVACVTGASRGIGRAIALRLAADGYDVAVNCRHELQQAAQTVQAVEALGHRAAVFPCDVGDPNAVTEMAHAIKEQLGEVSVLINNAGISQQKLFTDISDEDWRQMMAVHLDGTFYTCRAFLPHMIHDRNGCIVNVSSMWGQVGGSCEVHYSAAKAAVIGLTKALAKEVAPSGIRVNCVAPGVISTAMMQGFDRRTLDQLTEETPLMRLGTPEDVAGAVSYLVSEDAGFVTGQVLSPNGGFVI